MRSVPFFLLWAVVLEILSFSIDALGLVVSTTKLANGNKTLC